MKSLMPHDNFIYHGKRGPNGCTCMAGDKPLPPRTDIRNHSPDGFNWGYQGSGPAQLALAILCHAVGPKTAEELYQEFKRTFIAKISEDEFVVRREFVRGWARAKINTPVGNALLVDGKALLEEFLQGGK